MAMYNWSNNAIFMLCVNGITVKVNILASVKKYTFPRGHGHAEPPETSGHLPRVFPCKAGLSNVASSQQWRGSRLAAL